VLSISIVVVLYFICGCNVWTVCDKKCMEVSSKICFFRPFAISCFYNLSLRIKVREKLLLQRKHVCVCGSEEY
jgi:hypothetical protein